MIEWGAEIAVLLRRRSAGERGREHANAQREEKEGVLPPPRDQGDRSIDKMGHFTLNGREIDSNEAFRHTVSGALIPTGAIANCKGVTLGRGRRRARWIHPLDHIAERIEDGINLPLAGDSMQLSLPFVEADQRLLSLQLVDL